MSSHREAPEISKDPVADSTDVYAFVSPDQPDTVTLIANYIPLEEPSGGPNFHNFSPSVLYEIKIDNDGDAVEDIIYQFRFRTVVGNSATFLYNTNTNFLGNLGICTDTGSTSRLEHHFSYTDCLFCFWLQGVGEWILSNYNHEHWRWRH